MSKFETKLGDSVHCQELSTGQLSTGIFNLGETEITTTIYRYDAHLHIDDSRAIYLRTSKNDFVSLFGNISPAAGRTSRWEPTELTTFSQHIISNSAIIGNSQWEEGTHVALALFDIEGCEEVLEHSEITRRISRAELEELGERVLLEVQSDIGSLRVLYATDYSFRRDAVTDIRPYFELEFRDPQPLSSYLGHVQTVVTFMSLVTGRHLRSSNIRISPHNRADLSAALDAGGALQLFAAYYLRPPATEPAQDTNAGTRSFCARDDDNRNALQLALQKWMTRAPQWEHANNLMMHALEAAHRLTPERIVNACRWLEELPGAEAQDAIPQATLEKIITAANKEALSIGHNLQNRITGAIKPIGLETHDARFHRLTQTLEKRFGKGVFHDDIVASLRDALKFRGRAAHRNFVVDSDQEERRFFRSIYAMEAFCFLLMLAELPNSPNEAFNVSQHAFMSTYRLSTLEA